MNNEGKLDTAAVFERIFTLQGVIVEAVRDIQDGRRDLDTLRRIKGETAAPAV